MKTKMSVNKTVAVSQRQQLVDLNGETTNFDLRFTATSKNREPFDVLVVDQTTLDNNPNLDFRRAEGTISGNIVSDKNVYQNYFLCLKADQPCEVNIVIDKKEISPVPQPAATPTPAVTPAVTPAMAPPPITPPEKPKGTNWKAIIILIMLVGGILLYYMYSKKKGSGGEAPAPDASPVKLASPVLSVHEVAPKLPTPAAPGPVPTTSGLGFGGRKANESLIARLNSLPLK